MARKRRTPLYDLMRTRPGGNAGGSAESGAADVEATELIQSDMVDTGESGESWLTPGRAMQIPVGYLFLGGAAVILLLVVAYTVGYDRARRVVTAQYREQMLSHFGSIEAAQATRDPLLVSEQPGGALGDEDFRVRAGDDSQFESPQWGPIASDPRQPGNHYFVLAETRPDGAERLAIFCREQGLEAYVIAGHNHGRRRVIALPGFQQESGPEADRLREAIRQIGRRWHGKHRGESNLGDAYPLLFVKPD